LGGTPRERFSLQSKIEKGNLLEIAFKSKTSAPTGLSSTGEHGDDEQSRPTDRSRETNISPVSEYKDTKLAFNSPNKINI